MSRGGDNSSERRFSILHEKRLGEIQHYLTQLLGRRPDNKPDSPYFYALKRETNRSDIVSDHAKNWVSLLADERESFNSVLNDLKDQVLVDLGGGNGTLRPLLESLGWSGKYINVDYHSHRGKPESFLAGNLPVNITEKEINITADMLDFLQRIPDGMLPNVALFAIDKSLVADSTYHALLAQEIRRALKTGGFVIAGNATAAIYLLLYHSECFQVVVEGYDLADNLERHRQNHETDYLLEAHAFVLRKTC